MVKRSSRGNIIILVLALLFVAAVLVFAVLGVLKSENDAANTSSTNNSAQKKVQPKEEPQIPLVDLQPAVDQWLAGQSADFGIVVYDADNKKIIASHQPDKQYFAASLYKLFVAYLALEDFQDGIQNPGEILTQGFTRKECVDKMIRESHSPCGEAMMADMGQQSLTNRLVAMDVNNTSLSAINTSAQDSALILRYILQGRDLNSKNTEFLKNAMRIQDQMFRNGLAKGAPGATWETKVGWNQDINYHDVGIMTLPDDRQFVVAILSLNNGASAPIADFASTIYKSLSE